jgi:DNA-binding SARP family transcriptional activator
VLFRVLDGVGVVGDDGELTRIAPRKPRALLALLILNANRVIDGSVVMESLWGDVLPEHPSGALQVVVSRLRRSLGACGDRVLFEHGGYRLDAGPEEVDVLRAEALLRDGRAALGINDGARAAVAFEDALGLWTGKALEDLGGLPFAAAGVRRLHELWFALVEARNDAYLMDGRHLEVLVDIDTMVDSEPLRERLRAQQVVALYQAGRQAEALRAADALRKALRDELGLQPSSAMQDLERRVLDQDPRLLATEAGFMTPLPAWTAEVLPFVGREAELDLVLVDLAKAVEDGIRFVLIEGDAGIGKSRFLSQIARRVMRDAIVLPIHVHDVFSPALHAVARVVAEATLRLSDDELRFIIDGVPDVPNDVARVRAVASELIAGRPLKGLLRDEDLLRGMGRWIAALSLKAPVVLLVDDLDVAGTAVQHVIWKLAALSIPKRVLIVASARGPVDQTSPSLARIVGALERLGVVDRIGLPTFDADAVNQLLKQMRVAPHVELVDRLYGLTAGNPLLLAEILSLGPPERVVDHWSSRPRVRDVVRQRTAELGRATAEFLSHASLLEHDFTVELLSDIVGSSPSTVQTLVDRAVDAHVLLPSTIRSYRFCHQLFRQTLLGDLTPAQRADGHRRIACALERVESSPALLEVHWAGAWGADVPAKVVCYARAAGREFLRLFEPTAAASSFGVALEYLGDDSERGALLLDLAEAQQLAGDAKGIASLQEAVRIALATQDDELIVRIAQVTTPDWSTLPGIAVSDTEQLLARASNVVHDDATRSRILARQAIGLSLSDPDAAERMVDEAVALARNSRDRTALNESLLRRTAVSLSPHSLAVRRSALRELLDASEYSVDVATRYFALSASVVTAIQSGDIDEAEDLSAEADAIATQYDLAPMRWSSMLRRAWRTALAGQLDHAEKLIENTRKYGCESAITGAPETALIQLGLLRWQQDRVPETLPLVRAAFDRMSADFPGLALVLARVLAEHDASHDEARAHLAEFASDSFARLRRGTFWSSALILTAETACILDLRDLSGVIRDLLMPFADQVAFTGAWVSAPIAYGIGIAMTGCGDPRARRLLEQAADIADRINAPVIATRIRESPLADRGNAVIGTCQLRRGE